MPQAGITPDSWLYGLDNFLKELRLLVTFDAAAKAGLLDDISGNGWQKQEYGERKQTRIWFGC